MTYTKIVSIALGLAATAAAQMSGDGKINVINATDVNVLSLKDPKPFACLDVNGGVTLDMTACAVFNKLPVYPYTLSILAGNCTFQDVKQPENTEALYGRGSYAFNCDLNYAVDRNDDLFGMEMHNVMWMCFGIPGSCAYDLKLTDPKGPSPVWRYDWGSSNVPQARVPAGYTEVFWTWN